MTSIFEPDGGLRFLSKDKLKELTGYKQPSAIAKWLAKRGIPFFPRPNGWPAVAAHLLDAIERGDEIVLDAPRLEFNRQFGRNSGKVYRGAGVYALLLAKEIVYIGQTTNVIRRIGEHAASREFDEYRFIKCEADRLLDLERELILLYRPAWNISQNRDTPVEIQNARARAGIPVDQQCS